MTDNDRNALALITSTRDFSDTERRIVDYIVANRTAAANMTSAQLARKSGTSEATISRFCKHLGFGSYRSFQFSLARDLVVQRGNVPVTREVSFDDIEQSLHNIQHAKISEIEATVRAIDPQSLRAVVELIAHAGVIQVVAVGNTSAVALDTAIKFGQLGLRCTTSDVTENSTAFALTLHEGDVLLAISNSGKSIRLDRMARAARERGATVVLITGDTSSPLVRHANYVLQTVNYEALLTTGDFTFSKISATLVVEIIYNFLLPIVPDARERISTYEELIQPDKDIE